MPVAAVGAVATIAGSAISAGIQSSAASEASSNSYDASLQATDAQLQAAREAIASNEKMYYEGLDWAKQSYREGIDTQKDMYYSGMNWSKDLWSQGKSMLSPYITSGTQSLNKLNALYGNEQVPNYDPNVSVGGQYEWRDIQVPSGNKIEQLRDTQGNVIDSVLDQSVGAIVPKGTEGQWTIQDGTLYQKNADGSLGARHADMYTLLPAIDEMRTTKSYEPITGTEQQTAVPAVAKPAEYDPDNPALSDQAQAFQDYNAYDVGLQDSYNKTLSNLRQNFEYSPQYQFNKEEALDALDKSAASRGGLLSGQHMKDVEKYASNLASGEWNNYTGGLNYTSFGGGFSQYVNSLYQMAGLGANAAQTGASAATNTGTSGLSASTNTGANILSSATNSGNQVLNSAAEMGANNAAINLYSGNAQASGYINAANAQNTGITNQASIWSNALNNLSGTSGTNTWSNLFNSGNKTNTGGTFGQSMFNTGWT